MRAQRPRQPNDHTDDFPHNFKDLHEKPAYSWIGKELLKKSNKNRMTIRELIWKDYFDQQNRAIGARRYLQVTLAMLGNIYQCRFCPRYAASSRALRDHQPGCENNESQETRYIFGPIPNDDEDRFFCYFGSVESCLKRFDDEAELRKHMTVHTDDELRLIGLQRSELEGRSCRYAVKDQPVVNQRKRRRDESSYDSSEFERPTTNASSRSTKRSKGDQDMFRGLPGSAAPFSSNESTVQNATHDMFSVESLRQDIPWLNERSSKSKKPQAGQIANKSTRALRISSRTDEAGNLIIPLGYTRQELESGFEDIVDGTYIESLRKLAKISSLSPTASYESPEAPHERQDEVFGVIDGFAYQYYDTNERKAGWQDIPDNLLRRYEKHATAYAAADVFSNIGFLPNEVKVLDMNPYCYILSFVSKEFTPLIAMPKNKRLPAIYQLHWQIRQCHQAGYFHGGLRLETIYCGKKDKMIKLTDWSNWSTIKVNDKRPDDYTIKVIYKGLQDMTALLWVVADIDFCNEEEDWRAAFYSNDRPSLHREDANWIENWAETGATRKLGTVRGIKDIQYTLAQLLCLIGTKLVMFELSMDYMLMAFEFLTFKKKRSNFEEADLSGPEDEKYDSDGEQEARLKYVRKNKKGLKGAVLSDENAPISV